MMHAAVAVAVAGARVARPARDAVALSGSNRHSRRHCCRSRESFWAFGASSCAPVVRTTLFY